MVPEHVMVMSSLNVELSQPFRFHVGEQELFAPPNFGTTFMKSRTSSLTLLQDFIDGVTGTKETIGARVPDGCWIGGDVTSNHCGLILLLGLAVLRELWLSMSLSLLSFCVMFVVVFENGMLMMMIKVVEHVVSRARRQGHTDQRSVGLWLLIGLNGGSFGMGHDP
jgi:hypothetical protein